LTDWTLKLSQAQAQGQGKLIVMAQDLGASLFTSTEYTNLNTSNSDYVTDLYAAYLQRSPDSGGYNDWMAALNGGSTRAQVRHGFAYSSEFQGNVVRLCPVTSSSTSTSANLKYVLTDVQGSARVLMENNGTSSAILARHDYLPFGEEIWVGVSRTTSQKYATTDKVRQRFALTERDEASGLDHTWFRKFDSFAGRWTSPDPYGGSMSIGNPQSLNRYSYTQNDPVNFVDPSGLDPIGIPIGMPAPWGPIISGGGILPVPTGVVNIPIGGSGNGPSDGGVILGGMIGDTGIVTVADGPDSGGGGSAGGGGSTQGPQFQHPQKKPRPISPGQKAVLRKIIKANCLARKKLERTAAKQDVGKRVGRSMLIGCASGGVGGAYMGVVGGGIVGLVTGPGAPLVGVAGAVVGGILGCTTGTLVGGFGQLVAEVVFEDPDQQTAAERADGECETEANNAIKALP
jgi:RHS repeat-associated protein